MAFPRAALAVPRPWGLVVAPFAWPTHFRAVSFSDDFKQVCMTCLVLSRTWEPYLSGLVCVGVPSGVCGVLLPSPCCVASLLPVFSPPLPSPRSLLFPVYAVLSYLNASQEMSNRKKYMRCTGIRKDIPHKSTANDSLRLQVCTNKMRSVQVS